MEENHTNKKIVFKNLHKQNKNFKQHLSNEKINVESINHGPHPIVSKKKRYMDLRIPPDKQPHFKSSVRYKNEENLRPIILKPHIKFIGESSTSSVQKFFKVKNLKPLNLNSADRVSPIEETTSVDNVTKSDDQILMQTESLANDSTDNNVQHNITNDNNLLERTELPVPDTPKTYSVPIQTESLKQEEIEPNVENKALNIDANDEAISLTPEKEYLQIIERIANSNNLSPRRSKVLKQYLNSYPSDEWKEMMEWLPSIKSIEKLLECEKEDIAEKNINGSKKLEHDDIKTKDKRLKTVILDSTLLNAEGSSLKPVVKNKSYVPSKISEESGKDNLYTIRENASTSHSKSSFETDLRKSFSVSKSKIKSESKHSIISFVARNPKLSIYDAEEIEENLRKQIQAKLSFECLEKDSFDSDHFKIDKTFSDFSLIKYKEIDIFKLIKTNKTDIVEDELFNEADMSTSTETEENLCPIEQKNSDYIIPEESYTESLEPEIKTSMASLKMNDISKSIESDILFNSNVQEERNIIEYTDKSEIALTQINVHELINNISADFQAEYLDKDKSSTSVLEAEINVESDKDKCASTSEVYIEEDKKLSLFLTEQSKEDISSNKAIDRSDLSNKMSNSNESILPIVLEISHNIVDTKNYKDSVTMAVEEEQTIIEYANERNEASTQNNIIELTNSKSNNIVDEKSLSQGKYIASTSKTQKNLENEIDALNSTSQTYVEIKSSITSRSSNSEIIQIPLIKHPCTCSLRQNQQTIVHEINTSFISAIQRRLNNFFYLQADYLIPRQQLQIK